jgi:SAM-dependent methyltransferase
VNVAHDLICSSRWWGRVVERELLPWGLSRVELGDEVLEFGPGFGATTRRLATRAERLSVLELEERYCRRLAASLGGQAAVSCGDATAMPYPDGRFSAVVCFTMLHHVPSPELQERVFEEVHRVLRPGGMFAGTDSLGTGAFFRLLHIGDTLCPISPADLPARLRSHGFDDVAVDTGGRSFRFRARRPR